MEFLSSTSAFGSKFLDILFALGGASGGARPKVHVKIDEEEWIVKFPSSFDPLDAGVLEYKANKLAEEPEFVKEQYLIPKYSAILFSNSSAQGPVVNQKSKDESIKLAACAAMKQREGGAA